MEAEDFETAANLSSRLDAFKHSLAATHRALQACEDGCARLVLPPAADPQLALKALQDGS